MFLEKPMLEVVNPEHNSIQSDQLRLSAIESVRVEVPRDQIFESGEAKEFFDPLPNNPDLTEEYLYSHQPVTSSTVPVFSPSIEPVGYLDDTVALRTQFRVLTGPAIIVARKGYAGRLIVVAASSFIVHEDAYAIRPKPEYLEAINLDWFAGHYSAEFQANRTALWGIGDFPRERFRKMQVIIPTREFQDREFSASVRDSD